MIDEMFKVIHESEPEQKGAWSGFCHQQFALND